MSSAPTPLLGPTAPKKLCTRHAPRTAPTPTILLAPPPSPCATASILACLAPAARAEATGKNGQGHRARATRQSTGQGIAPRAPDKATRQERRPTRARGPSHQFVMARTRQIVTNLSPTSRHRAEMPRGLLFDKSSASLRYPVLGRHFVHLFITTHVYTHTCMHT